MARTCSLLPGVLPSLPRIFLRVGRDRSPAIAPGFLGLRRLELTLHVDGASESAPFDYDMITRRALDAVVVLAHFTDKGGQRHVWLRSAVRPPLALRGPVSEGALEATIWEVPAGLIEPGETPVEAAARELEEELGFRLPAAAFEPLGPWSWPLPAVVGEQHHFMHARVDGVVRASPRGDGHPLEDGASVIAVPLTEALDACRAGELRDEKTELALRRLAEVPT